MTQLVRLTIQAVLSAEPPASADTAQGAGVQPSASRVDGLAQRDLKTRLGTITLQLPLINDVPFVSRLFVRYAAVETSFLLLLGRILVRGRTTPETVRHLAENLCGHPFPAERIAEIAKAIDDELPQYLEQELEHTRGRSLAGSAR